MVATGLGDERTARVKEARRELRHAEGPAARRLRRLLRRAAATRPGRHDDGWQDRIEAERRRLRRDERPLSGARNETWTVGRVTKKASSPPEQGFLLFALARALGARRCLEMGTCVGLSAAYLGAAVRTVGGGGTVRSLEGHQDRADVAAETWQRLGLTECEVTVGRFQRTLPTALDDDPFDLAFVDGHHDGQATIGYVDAIRATSPPGTLLVLDDIRWSDDMTWGWQQVRDATPASGHADLGRLGLVLLDADDVGLAAAERSAPADPPRR